MAMKKSPKKKTTAKAASKRAPAKKKTSRATGRAPLVAEFMTRSPQTIGSDQTLARAHELMNAHHIRHLPVLEGGKLVGILSQRDVYFAESLDGSAPERITVDEAMTPEVTEASARTPLEEVVRAMIRDKHGSTVITDGTKIAGVFSTTDALTALLRYLPR